MYSFVLLVHCVHLPWQLEIPMGCPSSTQIYVLALHYSGEGMDFVCAMGHNSFEKCFFGAIPGNKFHLF